MLDEPDNRIDDALTVSAEAADSAGVAAWQFYRVEAEPLRVLPKRFLVTDDSLVPSAELDPTQLAQGLTYAQARRLRRGARTRVQIVATHEALVR